MPSLASQLDGAVVAVDCSVWISHAWSTAALAAACERPHVKLAFERVALMLAHGALPVLVLEGAAPAEKAAALMRRHGTSKPPDGRWLRACGRDLRQVAEAMGVPTLQAPGEAEAACAALCAAGRVDAVLTCDGDALCFGAPRVWKEVRLDGTFTLGKSAIVECTLEAVEETCGFGRVGLALLAALIGGDYNAGGAKGVGPEKSAEAIRAILDSGAAARSAGALADALEDAVQRAPDQRLLSMKACTACSCCGHGTTKKRCHGPRGCVECGTHPVKDGGNGKGGCVPLPPGAPCPCPFHRLAPERELARIAARVKQQDAGGAGVLEGLRAAQRLWDGADCSAAEARALMPAQPSWRGLDVAALERELNRLMGWDQATVRRKLLPVALEWGLQRFKGRGAAPPAAVPARVLHRSPPLFTPIRVKKAMGSDADASWRFVVEWAPTETAQRAELGDADEASWARILHAAGSAPRSARMALMRARAPWVVDKFEEERAFKEAKERNRRPKKQTLGEAAKASRRITDFFGARKPATGGAASGAGPSPSVSYSHSTADTDDEAVLSGASVEVLGDTSDGLRAATGGAAGPSGSGSAVRAGASAAREADAPPPSRGATAIAMAAAAAAGPLFGSTPVVWRAQPDEDEDSDAAAGASSDGEETPSVLKPLVRESTPDSDDTDELLAYGRLTPTPRADRIAATPAPSRRLAVGPGHAKPRSPQRKTPAASTSVGSPTKLRRREGGAPPAVGGTGASSARKVLVLTGDDDNAVRPREDDKGKQKVAECIDLTGDSP